MTATTEGAEWDAWAKPILKRLGALPHAKLSGQSSGPKKQTTRMLKAECDTCGFTFRATRTWLCEVVDEAVRVRVMYCPLPDCGGSMAVDLGDDGGDPVDGGE